MSLAPPTPLFFLDKVVSEKRQQQQNLKAMHTLNESMCSSKDADRDLRQARTQTHSLSIYSYLQQASYLTII